jgi:hypothetical protein
MRTARTASISSEQALKTPRIYPLDGRAYGLNETKARIEFLYVAGRIVPMPRQRAPGMCCLVGERWDWLANTNQTDIVPPIQRIPATSQTIIWPSRIKPAVIWFVVVADAGDPCPELSFLDCRRKTPDSRRDSRSKS